MRFIFHGVALLLLVITCRGGPFEEICTVAKLVVQKCWMRAQEEDRQNAVAGVEKCLKRKTLIAMDRIIAKETIQMPYGITLVRDEGRNRSSYDRRSERKNGKFYEMGDWKMQLIGKIGEVLRTHVFRFPLMKANVVTGRRRHHHHQSQGMMPLMMFGVMAMAIIAIPLGFQFLAVLGGKALLLAKLALILTSIQGLKKIAVSDVNYGFYESGSNHHHHPHHSRQQYLYDRRWQQNGAPGHHGYDQGFPDVPDQQPDSIYHIRPRISNHVPPVNRD
ncbi:PREDICTED: uncharacterized protein LOC108558310 [Nicrophorus vespilloides]|uniref:Uncharacterized protein LOC108558310 n=1 Tax=Nicrophorus vespilloides TaxID=110193 RepID=A0ABM1M7X5_NICVS|nr:PREDICTED: uncharacterized protein LOC108558310 [Nicrophorus vespilloides]